MNLTGNTIFITGGGSGIGRGLAEALHARGNQVIISGRRKAALEEVTKANPGMDYVELDVESPASIASVVAGLIAKYPKLNVVINNAGIMGSDDAAAEMDDAQLVATVTTNLLGPVRVTSAFIEHLKKQEDAVVAYTTSGLAFTPLARSAVYCATKAAVHSYILSQRYVLKGTSVKVLEIPPPYVQTELGGPQQAVDPRAMPLKEYIDETIAVLGTDTVEVSVQRVGMLRNNPGPNEWAFVEKFNDMMVPHSS
jgi:uncharacterized oxidoreductase